MRTVFLALWMMGCCDDAPPEAALAAHEVERETQPVAPTSTTFTVHEWGFIGHHYAAGADEALTLATGRGREAEGPPVVAPQPSRVHGDEGRPILYVHFDEPAVQMAMELTLDVRDGRMVEHLPTAVRDGSRYRWDVRARRGSCSAVERYPNDGPEVCGGRIDGYCEASHLAAYETDDAECLRVDGEEWNHLFYRTQVSTVLPIEVRRGAEGFVVRANTSLPGKLIRIRRSDRIGDTRLQIFEPPAAGEAMALPESMEREAIDGQRRIETELAALGMTRPETYAFLRAWGVDLFGSTGEVDSDLQDMLAPSDLAAKRDALIYFMPEDAVQAMAPLSFRPPAREVRRAILVRVDLGEASPESPLAAPEGARARVSWMQTRVIGSRDGEHLLRWQVGQERALQGCYEEALNVDERMTGLAEIRFSVAADGTTSDQNVQWRAGGSEALSACVAALVVDWSFGASPGAATRVFQPLLFDRR